MEACYASRYWARFFVQMGYAMLLLPTQVVGYTSRLPLTVVGNFTLHMQERI